MTFKKHPKLLPPRNPGTKIWRYMDLTKPLSLIEQELLYFVCLDKLSERDPFEDYYTNVQSYPIEKNKEVYKCLYSQEG